MKIKFAVLLLLCTCLLTACVTRAETPKDENLSDEPAKTVMQQREEQEQESFGSETSKGEINVLTPMTISSVQIPHSDYHLKIRMIEGQYSEQWEPGGYRWINYDGQFIFEVSDTGGNVIKSTNLNSFYNEEITFINPFDLILDNYNADGQLDFLLGQRFSSNGSTYKIFSIQETYEIIELPIEGNTDLYIADSRHSTYLERDAEGILYYTTYDQQKGHQQKRLLWQDERFIVLEDA